MSLWLRVTACVLLLVAAPALAKRPASAPSRSRQAARARAAAPPPARKPAPAGAPARTPAPAQAPDVLAFPGSGLLDPDGFARVWPGLLEGKVVVLDPGHGGSASGAVATRGLRESDLNLWVARELKEFLAAAGATVVMTRVGDTDCLIARPFVLRDDLVARAQVANHLEADFFLSCHHNDAPMRMSSAALQRFNRTEIYYRMDDEGPSRTVGSQIFATLWPLLSNTRSALIPGAFAVLRFNERPAVLGEPFYISAGLSEKIARMARFPAAEATRYLEGTLAFLRRAYDPPRIVRPIEGEVVDRETFPLWIAVPPVRPEPKRPVRAAVPAPVTTASTQPVAVTTSSTAATPIVTTSVATTAIATERGWKVPSAAEAAAALPTAAAAAASRPVAGVTTAPAAPVAEPVPWYWMPVASVEPTLVVTVAGRALPVTFDPVKRRALARLAGIPNGPVLVEASLVGPDGRHSPVTRRHFVFEMPAATIQAQVAPAQVDAAYRGPSVLTAKLLDARGMPIADGTPVPVLHAGRDLGRPRSRGGVIQLTLDPTPPSVPTTSTTSVVVTRVTSSAAPTPVVTAPPVPEVVGPPVVPPIPTRNAKKAAPKPRPSPVAPTTVASFIPGTDPTLPANLPSMPQSPKATGTLTPSVVFGMPAAPLPALVPAGPLALTIATASVSVTASSAASPGTSTSWLAGRAYDARTGLAIPHLSVASTSATTGVSAEVALDAQAGHFVLHARAPVSAALDVQADGYIAQTITGLNLSPAGGRHDVPVTPVLYGALHQHSIVFDADPGSQTGPFLRDAVAVFAGTGVDGAWATWDGAGDRTEQERARAANKTPAEFAVTVMDNIGGFLGGPVTLHHYHASERGKAIANSIADAFRRYYPPVSASRKAGGSYFLNNTRATTLGLSFATSRGSSGLRHDRVAYIVMHGLMRALRPELPKGRTIAGKAPAGVAPGTWMILGNGDRCRLDPAGQYTFLDVPPGRYAVWFQAETPDRRPAGRATFWIDVP